MVVFTFFFCRCPRHQLDGSRWVADAKVGESSFLAWMAHIPSGFHGAPPAGAVIDRSASGWKEVIKDFSGTTFGMKQAENLHVNINLLWKRFENLGGFFINGNAFKNSLDRRQEPLQRLVRASMWPVKYAFYQQRKHSYWSSDLRWVI